jgi:CarD family transcriptional regulator
MRDLEAAAAACFCFDCFVSTVLFRLTVKNREKPSRESLRIMAEKLAYKLGDYVVYPSHGVGKVTGIEIQEVGDIKLKVFVISFEKEKMTLRVPVNKANTAGMRKLSSPSAMQEALSTLRRPARIKRVMWSRRAQEYESKLHSGDPVSIAEVIRDLHPGKGPAEQSYSERQMYEAALERLARELAAIEKTDPDSAAQKLEKVLQAV